MIDQKKAFRKTKKFSQKLFIERGISSTQYPTKNIVLCNVGQATGLDKDTIVHQIIAHTPQVNVPKFIAEKGLSYSFLVFDNVEDAQLFYSRGHGKFKQAEVGPPVYMIYVDKAPDETKVYSTPNPVGLTIIENFITEEEESKLYKLFDWQEVETKGVLKNRQVTHYGYEFRYGTNDVDLGSPLERKIPAECDFILERLREHGVNIPCLPDQLTVNKYEPGQGIPSHVDKHSPFGKQILSVSLGGSVVMDWRHHMGKYLPVLVPHKSILVMEGEARYDWQHGIQARDWDPKLTKVTVPSEEGSPRQITTLHAEKAPRTTRMSLTFRWTRRGPCDCRFPVLCDSRADGCLTKDEVAAKLEDMHVHEVYEKIASHFSTTRHKRWPRVEQFVSRQTAGSVLLDLGCGNGKNILPRNDILQIGAERSWGLIAECRRQISRAGAADCARADLLACPLVDGCADAVICIAVVHHFSNQSRRIKAISEISRLLRKGGEALVTVWARDQSKANYLAKNKQTDKDGQTDRETDSYCAAGVSLPVHENRTQFEHSDVLVPWKLRGKNCEDSLSKVEDTLLRYYHVFDEGELDELVAKVGGLEVRESFYEQGNWCVIVEKIC